MDTPRPEGWVGCSRTPRKPGIRTSRITALISRDGGRSLVFGAARPSRATRLTSNVMTLAVQDLEPGEAVLLTTYESDGEQVSVAAPFTEATVGAGTREELLDEYVGESDGQQVVSTTGKAAYVP